MDEPTMRIGEVVRRTGVAAATIRVWQRRYGLLSPARSEGGQRLYSERDVQVLRQVSELVEGGWALAAAAGHASRRVGSDVPAGSDTVVATRVQSTADPAIDTTADTVALLAAHDAARAMLRAASPAEVVAALVDLVRGLGGDVGPAELEGDSVLPVDLGLGETDPLLARAEPFSVARLRLEAILPGLVEDARHMVAVLRAAHR